MKEPRVLVGCPVTSLKKEVVWEYVKAAKSLSYKNKEILLLDNSPDKKMFEELRKEKGIRVQKTEHLKNVREMIARDRNTLRETALREGFDYFFSLEQDVIPPVDAIEKLLENQKEVCSAAYFGYFKRIAGKAQFFELLPIAFILAEPELEEKKVWIKRHLKFEELFPSRLLEAFDFGLGCCLMHKSILEKVGFRYEEGFEGFDDVFFCRDARALGVKLWIDSSVLCAHKAEPWSREIRARSGQSE